VRSACRHRKFKRAAKSCLHAGAAVRAAFGRLFPARRISSPPVRRHLATVLTALSLLLCIATAAQWLRSHWHANTICCWHQQNTQSQGRAGYVGLVILAEDAMAFTWFPPAEREGQQPIWNTVQLFSYPATTPDQYGLSRLLSLWNRMSFGLSTSGWTDRRYFWMPYWAIMLLAAGMPIWWLGASRRRRKSQSRNICTTCGYDLRATPERCPECGDVPKNLRISN
jgi:hypothetical protein